MFQARLHAFIPPSNEDACIPLACSCCAATRLVLPAAQTVTTGISPGNSTLASALGSLALSASYASMCILPGMDHSTRSCIVRISSTVTGTPSSSHVLKVSTSIVFISVFLFRSRLVAPEPASPEVLVRACMRCIRWNAAVRQPHLQTRNKVPGNRPRSPCPWEDLRQHILQPDAHRAG